MGLYQTRIICDATSRAVVRNIATQGTGNFPSVVQGDNLNLVVAACQPTGATTGAPFEYIDLANSNVVVAFGTPGNTPLLNVNVGATAGNVALPTITIARVTAGVNGNANTNTNEVQSIAISRATQGSFSLFFGGAEGDPMVYGDSAANYVTALVGCLGANNCAVSKTNADYYEVTFRGGLANAPQEILAVSGNDLRPYAKQVNVPLTSANFTNLLNGNAYASTTVSIEASTGGDKNTLCLEQITVFKELIS